MPPAWQRSRWPRAVAPSRTRTATTIATREGSSGGPALVDTPSGPALVGVASRGGSDNAVCGSGNVIYTDVTAFRDFIAQAIAQTIT